VQACSCDSSTKPALSCFLCPWWLFVCPPTAEILLLTRLCTLRYATVSRAALTALDCREVNGRSILQADLSIDCDSGQHQTMAMVAWLGIAAWVIGIPVCGMAVVFSYRAMLDEPNVAGALGFLIKYGCV